MSAKRDADVVAAAEQVVGIEQAEGEAEQRGVGRKRDVALVPGELRCPSVSLPSCQPLVTTPISRIDAASEPENGPVSAKQRISSPRASRGK